MGLIRTADRAAIAEAAALILAGKLVAFPTETVYGLGANALDPEAVARIFAAKGRPASNPIIVHVGVPRDAGRVADLSDVARRLMAVFWPGPLTLVMPCLTCVPDIVTAGGATVGVRMPRHPTALALLAAAGVPIAAPSANRSESLSPTRPEHVLESLGDSVDMILDGGVSNVGLESTVLDVTRNPPTILRPGMVTAKQIAAALGAPVVTEDGLPLAGPPLTPARSPGMMRRHYAPRTPLRISEDAWSEAMAAEPGSVAVLTHAPYPVSGSPAVTAIALPAEPGAYAAGLYEALHRLDQSGAGMILVQAPPVASGWEAIHDRLQRAAAHSA
ncbi:MAG: L-threonylcarbamoyladenylate synthase [Capsulimonadaceae bacterium]